MTLDPMRGSLEEQAREFEKNCLYTPSVPGDEWSTETITRLMADFTRAILVEVVHGMEQAADGIAADWRTDRASLAATAVLDQANQIRQRYNLELKKGAEG